MRRASAAGKVSYRDAMRWVFRLSAPPVPPEREDRLHQPPHLVGEVLQGTAFSDGYVAPTARGSQVRKMLRVVLVVLASGRPGWAGSAVGYRPAVGWRSRRSTPPAGLGRRVRRRGPARPHMASTNSPFTLGMHHCCFRHGWRMFFSAADAPSRQRLPPPGRPAAAGSSGHGPRAQRCTPVR